MIRTQQAHLIFYAASHPGRAGKQNEDRFGVTAFLGGRHDRVPSLLAVLCDGIGGHRAGEVAAEMGVNLITEGVAVADLRQPLRTLEEAIGRASAAIYQASQADQGRAGMGATCACAWVIADRLYTANLGDSRIYLLRQGHILQLTTDHTWIQEALDAGLIMDGQGGEHPNAHVIRRYLGSKGTPEPDFRLWFFEGEDDQAALANQGLLLQPDDIILLCSDGLTDLVADAEVRAILETAPLADAPATLIEMANARGGHDNITVILLQMPPKESGGRRRWVIGCGAALGVTALLLAAGLLGWRWRQGRLDATEPPAQTETLPAAPTETPWAATPTLAPTASPTADDALIEGAPLQPSITPWPTDTIPSP